MSTDSAGSKVHDERDIDPGVSADAASLAPGLRRPADAEVDPRQQAKSRRFGFQRGRNKQPVSPVLEPVLQSLRSNHPKADTDVVQRAFAIAADKHKDQRRKSGDPFITHPVAVATILADIGMPPPVLAAALLHDTVEDTDYTLTELTEEFGEEIAVLVNGVTKLDNVVYGDAAQAETVRKMIVSMARDVRVLVIKLADRLHNARTWRYVSEKSAQKKARETLEIYAPLAHRMGMNTIKWELEDRSFQALYPGVYDEILSLVAEKTPEREKYLSMVKAAVEQELADHKIKAVVTGRPKHYYSIYQKMMVRGRELDDIHDLIGVRVLVDTVADCYCAIGVIHAKWVPRQGRFKDYIATPKFNMYSSLHTTILAPEGRPVEVQIRTHAMHKCAEIGVAAHWKYKDRGKEAQDMPWLRQLIDWQKDATDPGDFMDSLRYEMSVNEVYVYTPRGDVLALPAGSTPVDFAYAVHTEVGHRTVGAKVNDRLVGLDSKLSTGDRVEVILSNAENAGPRQDWLNFVKSGRARNKIKQWVTKGRREESIERGRDALVKMLRKQGMPVADTLSDDSFEPIARQLRYSDANSLYVAIGQGQLSPVSVVRHIMQTHMSAAAEEDLAELTSPTDNVPNSRSLESNVVLKGAGDVWTKLAKCCTPVPGDSIMGFVTKGHGVSVHQKDCGNAKQLMAQANRVVEVEWSGAAKGSFLVQILVEALDRPGLLADVTRVLSEHHVDIMSGSVKSCRRRTAELRFTFEMGDASHLDYVMASVHDIRNVYSVTRVKSVDSTSSDR